MPKNENKVEERKRKILEAKMKSPTKSIRDIARETNSSKSQVARNLKEMGQDGTLSDIPVINAIKDADLEIVVLGQSIILDRFRNRDELAKVTTRDISTVTRESQTRYSFLDVTKKDDKGDGNINIIHYGNNNSL